MKVDNNESTEDLKVQMAPDQVEPSIIISCQAPDEQETESNLLETTTSISEFSQLVNQSIDFQLQNEEENESYLQEISSSATNHETELQSEEFQDYNSAKSMSITENDVLQSKETIDKIETFEKEELDFEWLKYFYNSKPKDAILTDEDVISELESSKRIIAFLTSLTVLSSMIIVIELILLGLPRPQALIVQPLPAKDLYCKLFKRSNFLKLNDFSLFQGENFHCSI